MTISTIQDYVNQFIGDTTTNSVTAADRLRAIGTSLKELYNDLSLDFTTKTYNLDYFDTVNWYDITTNIAAFGAPVDIRNQDDSKNFVAFQRLGGRELALELNNPTNDSFAIETRDRKHYLGISHTPEFAKTVLHDCESLTSNGTWTLDATNGDGTNLTLDEVEYKTGSASLNFDIDVTQTANNKAVIYNADMEELDLSEHENLSSFLFWVYLPTVTNFTSVTLYVGSSSTAYWSATATTDIDGAAWVAGWNRVKIAWSAMSMTSTPDSSAIDFVQVAYNYGVGQASDTDYRLDDIIVCRPEKLKVFYETLYIAETSTSDSTPLTELTATTNVPFFSGIYDFYDKYVAHRAASILFSQMGMHGDADRQQAEAEKEKKRLDGKIPGNRLEQVKSFKPQGLNFRNK